LWRKLRGLNYIFGHFSHFQSHFISSVPSLSALTVLVPSVTYFNSFVAKFHGDWLRCYNNLFLLDTSAACIMSTFIRISNRNVRILWHHIIAFPIPFMYSIIYAQTLSVHLSCRYTLRLHMLYKSICHLTAVQLPPYFLRSQWFTRQCHPLHFIIPSTNCDYYKYSFFPRTIRDWNNLPNDL